MTTTAEQNKTLVREAFDRIISTRDANHVDEVFAPDFRDHGAPPSFQSGREGMKQQIAEHHNQYDGLAPVIEDQVAEGDLVTTRWSMSGHHKLTGEKHNWSVIGIVRVRDGKIVERWAHASPNR
jgi:predicted SnoaL-like aldol condensation-catalyzing enzyme